MRITFQNFLYLCSRERQLMDYGAEQIQTLRQP